MSRAALHNDGPLTFVISPSQLLQKSICYCLFGYQSKLLWEGRDYKQKKKEMLSSYSSTAAIQYSSSVNEPVPCLLQHLCTEPGSSTQEQILTRLQQSSSGSVSPRAASMCPC